MCTYLTEKIAISGSAKGASGWIKVTEGTVYLDHPVHAPFGHTLNIDFLAPELGPAGRVATGPPPAWRRGGRGRRAGVMDSRTGTVSATPPEPGCWPAPPWSRCPAPPSSGSDRSRTGPGCRS